jgi:plastocyanin
VTGYFAISISVFFALAGHALAAEPVIISQKGKTFYPSEIAIGVGDSIVIKNDDRVLHHVYVESPGFNFDSGEQPPGRRVPITFGRPGKFDVRCDIHPKMRLRVVVK